MQEHLNALLPGLNESKVVALGRSDKKCVWSVVCLTAVCLTAENSVFPCGSVVWKLNSEQGWVQWPGS